MALAAKKSDRKYTYKDYLNWPEDERWELIDGIAYDMSPAPSSEHQAVSRELVVQFADYLRGKPCQVFYAPFDVRLPNGDEPDEDIQTVVQPDIVIICDKTKIDRRGCKGSPDLIVEIVSPYTIERDLKEKLELYERAGVKEYWVVHPTDKIVMVFSLGGNGKYKRHKLYGSQDKIKVSIFEDLIIDLTQVFASV